ncbi:MAG: serine/threonine-protein kinase, partial [Kofleriaceae bacterium]
MSACLDDSQIAVLLGGQPSATQVTQARKHLDECAHCREQLAHAIAGLDPEAALALDARLPAISALALVATLPTSELETQAMGHVPDLLHAQDLAVLRGTFVDRYVVLDRIGHGAMGAVYAAYDPELDRKVALKLLRTDVDRHADELRARLLREGQAMARLSHPSVITIFDVGAYGDEIFIAMELVDGGTLRDWMQPRRPWRDVLALMLRAGAGLQAAHDAGIIHRDFKPDNVLVGATAAVDPEPRVRVTDFGLAVAPQATLDMPASSTSSATSSATSLSASSSARLPSLSGRISPIVTVAGSVLGSPAYMAPEQMDGHAGPRADQFSFCVTLYEALYGERPFAGNTIGALADAIRHNRIQPAPAGAQVPRWLRSVLVRGLDADEAQRYPSMTALLAALRANPARRLRRIALAALGALALITAGLGWHTVHEARALECGGGDRKLLGTWDPVRRAQVAHAFLATGMAYAPASLTGTRRLLDDYTGAWTAMHRSACEATRVRREQSEDLLDLRMLCLDEHRKQLRALVEVFAVADAETVEHAAA